MLIALGGACYGILIYGDVEAECYSSVGDLGWQNCLVRWGIKKGVSKPYVSSMHLGCQSYAISAGEAV